MTTPLHGRTAIITGAGRGLGAAIARAMADAGAKLVLADLNLEAAEHTARPLAHALPIRADVSDPADAQAIADAAVAHFGGIDILVNNAGIGLIKPFLDTTPADIGRVMQVNLIGPMLCAQAAARVMAVRGYGRIVNIASISGAIGSQGRTAYGASKAALEAMTRIMALELAPAGIAVNAISPGPIETDLAAAMHSEATRRGYRERTPAGRYGMPEEVAAAAVFLASEAASYVRGHTLVVDGGFAMAGLPPE